MKKLPPSTPVLILAALALGAVAIILFARGAAANTAGRGDLFFIENAGQFDPRVRYQGAGDRATLWATEQALYLAVVDPDRGEEAVNLRLAFPQNKGALHLLPEMPLDLTRTFVLPQGTFNPGVWGALRLAEVQPGLDLIVEAPSGALQFRLEGSPAAAVQIRVDGAQALVQAGSQALAQTPLGAFALPAVVRENSHEVHFVGPDGSVVAAAAGNPAPDQPSAGTLVYGSYYGVGGTAEYGNSIKVANNRSAYVGGGGDNLTFSSTVGEYVPQHLVAAFVVKMSPDGSAFDYIFTISGSDPNGEEFITELEVDSVGNAIATGLTSSTDFPATPGAFDTTPNGGNDAFVLKVNPLGSGVSFASSLGAAGNEWGNGVAFDADQNIFVTGFTNSAGFPTTPGAYKPAKSGGFDVFVAKFNSAGSTLLAGTFIGGSADEGGSLALDRSDILVDPFGDVYITGPTLSSNYPTLTGPFGATGCIDAYISKLSGSLSTLMLSTRAGGNKSGATCTAANGEDNGERIFLDAAGNIYITGYTASGTANGFPTTSGAFQTAYGGTYDGFLIKLDPAAANLLYGTYLGGTSVDVGKDIAVDQNGDVYLAGYTFSPNYPVSGDAYDSTLGGGADAFLTKIDPSGNGASDLVYSTYFGGSSTDYGVGLFLAGIDITYLTGFTLSGQASFPVSAGAADTSYSGDQDAYIAQFHLPNPATPVPTPAWTPAPNNALLPVTIHRAP